MSKEFKFEIIFNPDTKDCKITGPLNEPDLCLLGLEMARRILTGLKTKKVIVSPFIPQNKSKVKVEIPDLRNLIEKR